MRRALVLLCLVAVLLGPARGEDPNDPSTGRNVLSGSSQPGDWSTYAVTLTLEPGDPAQATLGALVVTYRVKGSDAHGWTILTETEPPHATQWATRTIAKDSERLRDLLSLGDDVTIGEVVSTLETRTVQDREFYCRKIEFTTTEGTLIQRNAVWIAQQEQQRGRDFHGVRMVALSTRPVSGAQRAVALEMEIRGHGRRNATEWGVTAKQLVK